MRPDSKEETATKIIGIVFVRNEERFVRRAVDNIKNFCDEILLVDRRSTDRTSDILQNLARSDSDKFHFFTLDHPGESHALLHAYVGRNCWVFGVDGDEIYDPQRLMSFRLRVLAGEFSRQWMILGNVLHCHELNSVQGTATGFTAPPSRSMVKLYNFAAIDAWDGITPERLHGGRIVFRTGYGEHLKLELHRRHSWDDSPLRCLHMCFLRRSSVDPLHGTVARESIIETFHGGWKSCLRRFGQRLLGRTVCSVSKNERYARGNLVTVATAPFFPEL